MMSALQDRASKFNASRGRLQSGTDKMEELHNLFNLFDTNGNGRIDIEELECLMTKLGFQADPEKLMEIVKIVDDNANGELEFHELCKFLKLAKQGIGIESAMEKQLGNLA